MNFRNSRLALAGLVEQPLVNSWHRRERTGGCVCFSTRTAPNRASATSIKFHSRRRLRRTRATLSASSRPATPRPPQAARPHRAVSAVTFSSSKLLHLSRHARPSKRCQMYRHVRTGEDVRTIAHPFVTSDDSDLDLLDRCYETACEALHSEYNIEIPSLDGRHNPSQTLCSIVRGRPTRRTRL